MRRRGLRGSFVRRETDQTNYDLLSTATDLTLPKPKREYLQTQTLQRQSNSLHCLLVYFNTLFVCISVYLV